MTIKNIFEHKLNVTPAEITDFVLRKIWMCSDSSDTKILINVTAGDAEEEF